MTDSADLVGRLLPCPFCGSDAEIERVGDRRRSTIYQCDSCGCSLETGEEWSHGRQWNERSDATIKALEARLSAIEAETREACALIAESHHYTGKGSEDINDLMGMFARGNKAAVRSIATAIRASAQKGGE